MKQTIRIVFGLSVALLLAALAPRAQAVSATGGTMTNYTDAGGTNWTANIFTNVGTNYLTVSATGGGNVQVLVVGGGGGGGSRHGAGGGAGGLILTNVYTVVSGSNYTVVVGGGGAGNPNGGTSTQNGSPGTNSSFGSLIAYGGGYGAGPGNGGGGGSGGGADYISATTGGAATNGQGNAGGTGAGSTYGGGGGGGAGGTGSNFVDNGTTDGGGAGGLGTNISISGISTWYAGGGGGGSWQYYGGLGGSGIGGYGQSNCSTTTTSSGGNGAPKTGSGGGGGYAGGAGGSGIVIVRYLADTGAPTIQNQPATSVTTNSATFNGYLSSTGTSATTVYVLWGTNNGAVGGSWANTNKWNPGDWTNNSYPSTNIINLATNQDYFYTFGATNSAGNSVASSPQYLITGALTVQATDPTGRVNAADTAAFTVFRPASCTNGALVVNYTLGGTAAYPADYAIAPTSGAAVIAQGQTSCIVTATPVWQVEGQRTIILTLTNGAYAIGASNSATATLLQQALPVSATGGTVTNYTDAGGTNWTANIFTNVGTTNLTVTAGSNFQVLVVGGGGGGGIGYGSGGGAGGYRYVSTNLTAATYTVVVGDGGAAGPAANTQGSSGTNSSFEVIVAAGGGGGGGSGASPINNGLNGGSGGGSCQGGTAGNGNTPATSPSQGNNGANGSSGNYGGGGGGAGSAGSAQNGGTGISNSISGVVVGYCGGGAGNATAGAGGLGTASAGGGGRYGSTTNSAAPNTGGGGCGDNIAPGKGGSGIVIVRYLIPVSSVVPSIQNQTPSLVTTNSATFNGYLSSTGSSPTTVYMLWGANNGSVSGSWANTNWWSGNAWTNNTLFSTNMSLAANQDGFYSFGASNSDCNVVASPPQYLMTAPVGISLISGYASEVGLVPSTFTVYRASSATNGDVTVTLTPGGSAVLGQDYTMPLTVTIYAGQTNATFVLTPINNQFISGTLTATVAVASGGTYPVDGSSSNATTTIADAGTTASLWWDTSTGSGLTAGTGIWSTSDANWATNASPGGASPGLWVNGYSAIFAASGASTVTVNGVKAAGVSISAGSTNLFQSGSGPLTNGSLGITVAASVPATFNNDIVLSANQTWNNNGSMTVTGQVSGAGVSLTEAGAGALVLSNAANSFSGGLTVNNGSVNAYGQGSGTVLGNGPVTLGTVVPTDGSAFSVATVTLANGGAGSYTNTIGNLTNSGAAVLALNSVAGTTNTLIAGGLKRAVPGTLVVAPQNSLAVRENVKITGTASLVNGIVPPWAVNSLNNGDYVTTNSAGALTNATYVTSFNSSLTNQVVSLATATNLSANQTSYVVRVGANLNLKGNNLTVGDGAMGGVIFNNNTAITNSTGSPNLDFGTAEALLYVGAGNSSRIATPLTGSGALTKFGGGTLVVSNTTLWPGSAVNLNGGALNLWANQDKSATNWINGPGAFTKDGPNTLTLRGTNAIGSTLTANGGGTLNIGTSGGNDLLLSGGGIVGNGSANNAMNLASNATWNLLGQNVTVGSGTAGGNVLTINSGVITNGGVIVGGSSGSLSNGLVVNNGNQFLGNINVTLGNAAGANSNYYNVGGGAGQVIVSNGAITVGSAGAWNTMTISNANLWSGGLTIGNGNNNTVTVLSNSTWNLLGNNINIGVSSVYNNQMVINGGTVTNAGGWVTVGSSQNSSLPYNNNLTVRNGGALYMQNLLIGQYSGSQTGGGNSVDLGGPGVPSTCAIAGVVYVGGSTPGNGSGQSNNRLTITNAYVTVGGSIALTQKGGSSNRVYVLSGGTLNASGGISITSGGGGGGNNNFVVIDGGVVTGASSTVSIGGDVAPAPYQNWLTITNAGKLYNQAITLGASGGYSNTFTVTGVGSLCNTMGKNVSFGSVAATNNLVFVLNGALLEANGFVFNNTAGHVITNSGSVYQFNTASPTMTATTTNNCFITSGTISFRAITNADVLCNQSGKPFDSTNKMAWAGVTNAFRLNNATNLTSGQGYTFTTAYGSTNFGRLELFNGSLYRGGGVTLGVNGSLYVSGPNAIGGVLTAADASATIEFDLSNSNALSYLVAQTNVYLNGCNLQLDLANPPLLNMPMTIISNVSAGVTSGSFAGGGSQYVTVNGTNYTVRINTAGGSGRDVVVTTRTSTVGTLFVIQ